MGCSPTGLCTSIGLSFSLSWVSLSQPLQLGDELAGGVDGDSFSAEGVSSEREPAATVVAAVAFDNPFELLLARSVGDVAGEEFVLRC